MSPAEIAKIAFRLHEQGHLSREDLLQTLRVCVNGAATLNGYAPRYGMPFPGRAAKGRP